MRELWKKCLILAAIGFAAGVLLGLIILSFTGIRGYQQRGIGYLMLYIVTSGILGAVNMGATVVYSVERWGLLRTTLTHFGISIGSVCAVGFSVGWLSSREPLTWYILAACVALYFVIWLAMYYRYKREVRRMNEALKRWKRTQRDD